MTNEERIATNAAKGYILVASFDGWEIYKKANEVGGFTYYSDKIGHEGAYPIWDTAINSTEELLALVEDLIPSALISFDLDKSILQRHPGELLAYALEQNGIDLALFAQTTGLKQSEVGDILKGKVAISDWLAYKIGTLLNEDPHKWIDLQSKYDKLKKAVNDSGAG